LRSLRESLFSYCKNGIGNRRMGKRKEGERIRNKKTSTSYILGFLFLLILVNRGQSLPIWPQRRKIAGASAEILGIYGLE
jgi:hypothetical protein